jgi:glycosyltransferase involved in cell wall biosynthesis
MARGVAREEAFDTIHAHDWKSIPAGIAAKDQRGVPLVIHIHSLESDRSPVRIDERIYGIERFGMIAADHVIAVSSYTKKKIIDQYGISPEKISVVHNAAFSIECAPDVANKKTGAQVLFLGRLSEQKGPGKFMEAARKVNALDPDVRFVIAGEGELAEKLKEEAEFFEMEKYLRFTGFVGGPEVCRLYAASDLYVMPSISEPFGITALEAVLCGTPVILSCHSGVTEVLARAPRIDPQDTAGLAVRILEVIHDSEKKSRIVSECREDMRGIGWGKTAEDIMGIYKRVEAKGAL